MIEQPDYITMQEAANISGYSRRGIHALVERGRLAASWRSPRVVLVDRNEVLKLPPKDPRGRPRKLIQPSECETGE